jgi:hypothetical protein
MSKVVIVRYTVLDAFKIPTGIDLEDKSVVKFWGVKWNELYITFVDGTEKIIESEGWTDEPEFKYPDEHRTAIESAKFWGLDEEEEESNDEWNPDGIEIKDDELGLCNVCNHWEPICKFLEEDKIKQPCKGCYSCDDDDLDEFDDCICEEDENGDTITNKDCPAHDCCKICSQGKKCKFNDMAWLCYDCQKQIDDEIDAYSDKGDE